MRGQRALPLLALLLAACAAPPIVGDPAPSLPDAAQEASYRKILERETVRQEVYALFDTRMFVSATYQSLPFREARVRRMAAFQHIPESEVETRLQEERSEAGKFHDFMFGVHMNDLHFDDFGRPNSIWRVVLQTASGEVKPESIHRIGRSDLNIRALYPVMGTFWVAYRLRFPVARPDGTPVLKQAGEPMTLRIASNIGRADLKYEAR